MRRRLCSAILGLEAVALALVTPVLIALDRMVTGAALMVGLGLMVLCIVGAAVMAKPAGIWIGWFVQVAAIALGFWVAPMFVLGAIFALLWFGAIRLGGRIDRDVAAREDESPAG